MSVVALENTQEDASSGSSARGTRRGIAMLVGLFLSVSIHIDRSSTKGVLSSLYEDTYSEVKRASSSASTTAAAFCSSLPVEKPRLFNPFTDFEYSPVESPETGDPPPYSSVQCVGLGRWTSQSDAASYSTRRPNFVSRTCRYRNLYYRPSDQTFHYHPSGAERRVRAEALQAGEASASELFSRTEVSMSHTPEFFTPESLARYHVTPWKPNLLNESWWNETDLQISAIDAKHNAAFLLYQPFHAWNLGHFIWDELLSIFSMLDLFDMQDDLSVQAVPFFVENHDPATGRNYGGVDNQWRCHPHNWRKYNFCVNIYRKFFPPLFGIQTDCSGDVLRTGNWLLGESPVGRWHSHPKEICEASSQIEQHESNIAPADYILLPQVLVGTGRLSFFGCEDDCTIGRGPQFWRFRNYLMRHLFGPRETCHWNARRPAGYVTFSLSVASSRPDQVHNFTSEIEIARDMYGNDTVRVVNMAAMTIQEQAACVLDSAVVMTNHGGVGVTSIFLPRGSSAIVFWHGDRKMEHNFYESAGYFRTTWVGVEERPYVNRTMALIAQELERFQVEWGGDQSA